MPRKSNNNNNAEEKNQSKRRKRGNTTTATIIENANILQMPPEVLVNIFEHLDFRSFYMFLSICSYTYNLFKNSTNQTVMNLQYKIGFFRTFGNYLPKNKIDEYIDLNGNFENISDTCRIPYTPTSPTQVPIFKRVLEYTRTKNHDSLLKELKSIKFSCMFTTKEHISPLLIASRNGDMRSIELLLKHEYMIQNLLEFSKMENLNSEEILKRLSFKKYFTKYFFPAIEASFRAKDTKISMFFLKNLSSVFTHKGYFEILKSAMKYPAPEIVDYLLKYSLDEEDTKLCIIMEIFANNLNISQEIIEILDRYYGDKVSEHFLLSIIMANGNKPLANFYCLKKGLSLGSFVIRALTLNAGNEKSIKNLVKFFPEMTPDQQDEFILHAIYYRSKGVIEVCKLRNISVEMLILTLMKKRKELVAKLYNQHAWINDHISSEYLNILFYLILINKLPFDSTLNDLTLYVAQKNQMSLYSYITHIICSIIRIDVQIVDSAGTKNTFASNYQETEGLITLIKEYFSLIFRDMLKIIEEAISKKHTPLIAILHKLHQENYFTTDKHINDSNPLLLHNANPKRSNEQLISLRKEIDILFLNYELEKKEDLLNMGTNLVNEEISMDYLLGL